MFRGGGGDVTKAFINLGILFLSRTVDLSVRTKRTRRRRVPVSAAASGAIVSVQGRYDRPAVFSLLMRSNLLHATHPQLVSHKVQNSMRACRITSHKLS